MAAAGVAEAPHRTTRRTRPSVTLALSGVLVAAAAGEVAPRLGILPRSSFPPTSEVAAAGAEVVTTGQLWLAVGDTLEAWVRAMAIAVLVAVPVGLVAGASRTGALLSRLTVEFLRPIPSVALIPLLLLIYGPSTSLKVALGAFGATFPLLFQAMYAIGDVDAVAHDTARAFGLGAVARLRWVVLPSCGPYLATGLRISASVALILVVTGEYVVGVPGLGREVLATQSGGAYDRMYALIVVAGLLGVAVNLAFGIAERRILFWHPGQRRDAGDRQ